MTARHETNPGDSAKVLIADDNPQGVELLEAYLADTPYEVRVATNGEETLEQVRSWHPDLVLLDVMMPKLSGFEVCKQLRSDPRTQGIAVLMITALDQTSDVERAVEAGTDDFLTKPINKAELLLRVRALLESRVSAPVPTAGEESEGGNPELESTLRYFEAVQHHES